MDIIKVLALDPSIRNFGIARLRINIDTLKIAVEDLQLIQTESRSGKQVRKNSDDLRRAQEIARAVRAQIATHGVKFVISEVPSGAQSARAAFLLGSCVGILGSLTTPLIQVQPLETKLATVGRKTASKQDMIDWAMAKHPEAPWLLYKSKGVMVPNQSNEHLADAVGVGYAGILTNEFQQAVALLRSLTASAAA